LPGWDFLAESQPVSLVVAEAAAPIAFPDGARRPREMSRMDEAGLDPSEKSLLERAVNGDVEAFSELVRTHYPAVRVYLGAQIHDDGALDDLAQDVFLRAFRGLRALRQRVAFRAWLIGIARNRALEYLRERMRLDAPAPSRIDRLLDERQVAFLAGEDEDAQRVIDLDALRQCMARLPPGSARLVEEHYFKGRTIASLAVERRKSAGSVRMALLRLRDELRECIRRYARETGS
jgi:RNA polymerase sigma-70 factor (ECF subfamily)